MERLAPLVDVRQRRIRLGALLVQPLPAPRRPCPRAAPCVVGSVEHQRFRQLAGNLHREGRAIALMVMSGMTYTVPLRCEKDEPGRGSSVQMTSRMAARSSMVKW